MPWFKRYKRFRGFLPRGIVWNSCADEEPYEHTGWLVCLTWLYWSVVFHIPKWR